MKYKLVEMGKRKHIMYMLNKKDTEKLLAIFPNVSEQKEDEIQVGPLTEVTKKDLQITDPY